MESFHIDSELGQESLPKKYFYGNMRVYNSGRSVFNRKAIGIYITLTISLSSAALLSFLVYDRHKIVLNLKFSKLWEMLYFP
jgi:hypothetical protein